MRRCLVCGILVASTLTASASFAQALGDTSGLSAAVLAGYGTNNLNLGFGARVGYTLPAIPIYIGGTFLYHLGTSESSTIPSFTGGAPTTIDSSSSLYYFGAEGGYNISLGPVALRPYVGIGAATATVSILGVSASATDFAIWPGAVLLVPVGPVFVGGDARVLHAGDNNYFGMFGTVGMKF